MSTNTITFSSELMKNYIQAELMSPDEKFEALQTDNGCSLLFSIGTDGTFYVTQESTGNATGWIKTDLSTALIQTNFNGVSGVTCKSYDVAQNATDGTIGLAVIINDTQNDHLFLCLGNSNADTSWLANPTWASFAYDNPNHAEKTLVIQNVFISETLSGTNHVQYVFVDIIQDPSSAEKLIARYYIDLQKSNGYFWHSHNISIDLEAAQYSSCVGRQSGQTIDGIYTIGQVDGNPQFVYQPLCNIWNPSLPASTARLNLPGAILPEAIASSRNADQSTDLYVVAQGGIYYFASTNQQDQATGVLLFQNDLFTGATYLYAYSTQSSIFLWGLNQANQVFYTTCNINQIGSSSAWSLPLPILTGIDLISPYVNLANQGNTFFAVGGNELYKMMQSPTNFLWTKQSITLPSLPNAPAHSFSSYTTRIQLTNENNQAVSNVPLLLSANTRGTFFINNLYYVLDTTPVPINTDAMGSITIVESVNDLRGTRLTVSEAGSNAVQINPMDAPMNKMAQLNTADSLTNANITNDDGSTTPLVNSTVSQDDLKTVASNNANLVNVYKSYSGNTNVSLRAFRTNSPMSAAVPLTVDGIEAILIEAGDFFLMLASEVESVIQIIEDTANQVWHFIATIAGQAYSCILNCVEKVVGAFEWLYNMIETGIEDLIKFLEFLFGWQDILTTHNVMKNVFLQFAQQNINSLSDYKTDITNAFQSLQTAIDGWAGIPNFDQTLSLVTAANPIQDAQNSAPANLGIHHFQGNLSGASTSVTPATISDAIFEDLMNLLNSEEATLSGAYNAIQTDIIDQFDSLTLSQIIEKFVAIITDTLLQTAENILIAVLDVFVQLLDGFVDLLNATIDIPVISWLYKEISGNDLSFLDLICLIAAIPATIIYKMGSDGTAPFIEGDAFTSSLLNATNFSDIQNSFMITAAPTTENRMMATMAEENSPVLDDARLKTFGFVSGFFAFAGTIVLISTSALMRALDIADDDDDHEDDAASNGIRLVCSTVSAIGNIACLSPNIATLVNAKTSNWYQLMNSAITGVSIIKGFANIGLIFVGEDSNFRKISPGLDSLINFIWNVPVIANIAENADRSTTDYKSLIPESIGNFGLNFGGMLELPIALTKNEEVKAVEILSQYALMGVYGICMPIAGGIYQYAPGQ